MLPLAVLLDPAAPQSAAAWNAAAAGATFWVWPHPEHYIWGATAAILVHLAARAARGVMLRFAEIGLFLLPFALYAAWRVLGARATAGLLWARGGGGGRAGGDGDLVRHGEQPAGRHALRARPDARRADRAGAWQLTPDRAGVAAHRATRFSSPIPACARCWPPCPARAWSAARCATRWPGGSVADVDLATSMRPDEVIRRLREAGLKAVPTGLDHGTVTAVADHRGFEVTTLRRDVETDGRHAVVDYTDDWREDAARRDFTINAMSMAPDGDAVRLFRRHRRPAGRAWSASSATRRRASPRTICASCAFFASMRVMAPAPRTRRRWRRSAPACRASRGCRPSGCGASSSASWPRPTRAASVALMAGHRRAGRGAARGRRAGPAGAAGWPAGAPPDPVLRLAALLDGDAGGAGRRGCAFPLPSASVCWPCARGAVPADAADDAMLRRALADTPPDILIGRAWLAGRGAALARPAGGPAPAGVSAARPRPAGARRAARAAHRGNCWGRCANGGWHGGCTADAAACRAELARLLAG